MGNYQKRKKSRLQKKKAMQRMTLGTALIAVVIIIGIVWLIQNGGPQVEADQFQLAKQPSLGDPNAPVKVVEFGDYKCPACKLFHEQVFSRLRAEFITPRLVEFYFINFQFIAPDSVTAGIAGECILRQDEDSFWEYHNAVYENQGPESQAWASRANLMRLVREHVSGINEPALEQCIAQETHKADVEQDMQIGRQTGVRSTPSIFVNGQKVANPSYNSVKRAIERALEG